MPSVRVPTTASVGGTPIFVGGIPKKSTDEDLRFVFPNGAHIKRSRGRGNFDFAKQFVYKLRKWIG